MDGMLNLRFSDLPTWRKVVLSCAVALFLLIGLIAVVLDFQVYRSAPRTPVATTQQIFPVELVGGSIRYVSASQEETIEFWQRKIVLLVGIPFAAAFLVIATFRQT